MLHIEASLCLPDGSLLSHTNYKGPVSKWEDIAQQVFLNLQNNGLHEILAILKKDENEKA